MIVTVYSICLISSVKSACVFDEKDVDSVYNMDPVVFNIVAGFLLMAFNMIMIHSGVNATQSIYDYMKSKIHQQNQFQILLKNLQESIIIISRNHELGANKDGQEQESSQTSVELKEGSQNIEYINEMFYEYFKPFTEKYDIDHSQWKSELAKDQPKDFYSKYCIKLASRCKKSKQLAN